MKSTILAGVALLSLLMAPLALAQTYYPYASACVSVPAGLSTGSRGSQVSTLQSFLVSRNYPGGGSWMISGYFGQATAAGVRDFQQSQGLLQTGVVDAATAAAISRVSCGGVSTAVYPTAYPYTYPASTYPTPYNYTYNTFGQLASIPYSSAFVGNYYPYTYGATYSYNNNYCLPPNTATPIINYLSPQSGAVGTSVSVYGSGFSTSGNTVHFGTGIVANLNSYDGRSVSFTIPNTLTGFGSQPVTLSTYQVSVTNSAGITSNSMPFTVTGLISSGAPTITSVSGPTSLAVGGSGLWTVYVNTQNNTYLTLSVNWGDQNVYGSSGTQQVAYGSVQQTNTLTHTYYQSGTYTILFTVSNSAGQQNTFTTTVVVGSGTYLPTGQAGNNPSTSFVSIINFTFSPSYLTVRAGTTVTWTNNDSASHTVTSNTNFFASGTLYTGQSFSYTFATPGTYTYYCSLHPMMRGTIVVQ